MKQIEVRIPVLPGLEVPAKAYCPAHESEEG